MTYRIDAIDETTGTLSNVETGVSISDTLHKLAAYLKMLENMKGALSLIRKAESIPEARTALQDAFGIDAEQADAMLAMRLETIANLERDHVLTDEEIQEREAERERWAPFRAQMIALRKEVREERERAAAAAAATED